MIDFPSTPSDGQQYAAGGSLWTWSAANQAWMGGAPVGSQGPIGPPGTPGGPTGATGATGPQGATGAQGAVGSQGPQGAAGGGPQGPAGPAGTPGTPGSVGPQGPAGPQGPSGAISDTSQFLMQYKANNISGGGSLWVSGTSGVIANASPSRSLEIQSVGAGHAAYLTYHMVGAYAAMMGIDPDGHFKVGGWSMGNVSYKLLHEGNAFSIDTSLNLHTNRFVYFPALATGFVKIGRAHV